MDTEPAYEINRSIPADQTPLRITDTGYRVEKHRDIDDRTWKGSITDYSRSSRLCHTRITTTCPCAFTR
jgi:hypothetical protein